MRMWRNWQTRWFQVPVKRFMWVQVPSSAPCPKSLEKLWIFGFFFCFSQPFFLLADAYLKSWIFVQFSPLKLMRLPKETDQQKLVRTTLKGRRQLDCQSLLLWFRISNHPIHRALCRSYIECVWKTKPKLFLLLLPAKMPSTKRLVTTR